VSSQANCSRGIIRDRLSLTVNASVLFRPAVRLNKRFVGCHVEMDAIA
jgi:hypothetical protein